MVDIEMAEGYSSGVNGITTNGVATTNGVNHKDLFDIPDLHQLQGRKYIPGPGILPQQVAYSLSSTIFQYTDGLPESDSAVVQWSKKSQRNPLDVVPNVEILETRSGAGSFVLGYSSSEGPKDKSNPESVFSASATIQVMEPVLKQLQLNY